MRGILFLELFIIVFSIWLYNYMTRKGYKHVGRKLAILFVGVLLFEIISEPMWLNLGFDQWAYIYRDITWILTLGWMDLFMVTFILVDFAFPKLLEKKKFWMYALIIEAITVPIEMALLQTGVRQYAPVLRATFSGFLIPFTIVPIEAIYAIPLFTSLIIAFYKYVNYLFETA